jgi:hypothetical protein
MIRHYWGVFFFCFFYNCAWKVVLTENVASKEETNKINRERRRRKKNKQVEKKKSKSITCMYNQ